MSTLELLFLLLSATACAHISGASAPTTEGPPALAATQLRPEIINELKDFIDLIPTAVVDELIAKHYITDSNFREALKYLRSGEFTQLLQRIQQIPEIIEILDFLHLRASAAAEQSSSATCERPQLERGATAAPQLEIVLLARDVVALSPQNAYELRTFSTFVQELVQHLPRARYAQLINEKRQKNAAFAEFYAALRSARLSPLVDAAMKSTNLAAVIKTLNANDLDVNSLKAIAFQVISWGPAV